MEPVSGELPEPTSDRIVIAPEEAVPAPAMMLTEPPSATPGPDLMTTLPPVCVDIVVEPAVMLTDPPDAALVEPTANAMFPAPPSVAAPVANETLPTFVPDPDRMNMGPVAPVATLYVDTNVPAELDSCAAAEFADRNNCPLAAVRDNAPLDVTDIDPVFWVVNATYDTADAIVIPVSTDCRVRGAPENVSIEFVMKVELVRVAIVFLPTAVDE
jgi:hypothetical protein